MNRPQIKPAIYTCLILLGAFSCKYNLNKMDVPDWQVDLLGPVARSDLRLEDLSQLEGLEFTESIGLSAIGFSAGPAMIPEINIPQIGPFPVEVLHQFVSIHANSLSLSVTIENDFPFTINKGMRLIFTNSVSGSFISTFDISEDIPPGASYSYDLILSDVPVESTIHIAPADLSTHAQPVVFEQDDHLTISFHLLFIKIGSALIHPSQTFSLNDTTEFDLQGDQLDAAAVEGFFNLYLTNSYPLQGEVQVYFLSASNEVLDSLFSPRGSITLPPLAGNAIASPLESKLSIPVDEDRVEVLKHAERALVFLQANIL